MTTNNPLNIALGQAIRTCRDRSTMTPEEVAKGAGIPLDEYLQIEKGEIEARWGDLRRIAERALKMPLSEMLALIERGPDCGQKEDASGSQAPPDTD
jgi:transcriptional regulator with XRE-family HTH domain